MKHPVSGNYIKDNKYNILQIVPEEQTYTLLFNSQLKFKNTVRSMDEVNWGDIPLGDFVSSIEFGPNYTLTSDIASRVSLFKIPKLDFFIILDEKSNKIIYTDENLKKVLAEAKPTEVLTGAMPKKSEQM